MRFNIIISGILFGLILPGCPEKKGEDNPPDRVYPSLAVVPEHKELILSRVDREPYLTFMTQLEDAAARDWREREDPAVWDHGAEGQNGATAQANAVLAWLYDDEDAALKARDFFDRLQTDFETNSTWDVNIRMPHPLMGFTDAWDLLMATPWFPEEEAAAAADKICEITGKFFDRFLEDDFMRTIALGQSQNNHPIRTASAIGYVALAFPDHPEAAKWANWAFSELQYLWGPEGRYVQPDGGVSEGPFYYNFAWGVANVIFIAVHNLYGDEPLELETDCRNRQPIDPWLVTDCPEGEPFVFQNPLFDPQFVATIDWSMNLRLPFGPRPPLGDANFSTPPTGVALLTGLGHGGRYRWDFENVRDKDLETGWGADTKLHHLAYFDDSVAALEPSWKNRFLPAAGNAVFRSGWDDDARWLLLMGEEGAARKTLHDHVDGTSYSLAAYGEYLLIDTGYYKPNDLNNAVTAHSPSHNVVLIEGRAAPDKGLLTDFDDADAWIRNTLDGSLIAYAESHQWYQDTTVERSVAFVDNRYFVVADHLSTDATGPRAHAYRLHGYAGYDEGGVFELRADGARWERALAGVDVYLAVSGADGATALAVVEPPFVAEEAPHVHQFDWQRNVAHHGVMDATVLAAEPEFLAVLMPYRVGAAPGAVDDALAVSAVDLGAASAAGTAAAWSIALPDAQDLALQRDASAPTSFTLPGGAVLETDARFVALRLSGPRAFAVLCRGTYLRLDGADVLTAANADGVELWEQGS